MSAKRNSFLEKELQDLLVSAGRDRPNLNSSQSTLSPCVRTRQQKEKNRRSLETLLPAPAILALPPPGALVGGSNSERRLKVIPQVIIRQTSAVTSSSKVVPSEVGLKEEPISPSLTDTTGTNSSSRFLRSGRVFQEIKHVSRPRTRSHNRPQSDDIPKSQGSNRRRLNSRLVSSKYLRSIACEGPVQSNTVKSPILKLLSRQGRIVTSASVPKDWIYSPLSDRKIIRHLRAILQAIRHQSSKKQANLAIVKTLFKSSRVLSTRRIASRTWS
ncbi:hypothetical protein EAF04_001247 [Stromatinia cepivora]|nr:hypothetical protein EAF04_001247 [Stromatinia cepivora]